ncbi:MAG: exodeoxyribonuclease VII large subunit [Thermoguttaceae bacterium]|nr:exodeoxyribonuclease VII large subunit [Thermoguttaceae bacterium]
MASFDWENGGFGETFEGTTATGAKNVDAATGEGGGPPTLSVGELTRLLKSVVEEIFFDVCVVGEISNLSQPKSGHAYFTLKDETAQLSAAIWKSTTAKLKFDLRNGMQVVCRGRIEVYPPHGKYQLVATSVEPMGVGALELAFQQLQEKLAREGLFAPERKKRPPKIVRRIGLATSATGAAIRDFLNVLGRRTKRVDVVVAPTKVQGDGAARDVVRALTLLHDLRDELRLDAIALVRGGGSVEDLWTFNEEPVVRAIAASRLPVATGIGHEIDVSLSDLAADLHALTPSDAAARLVPEDEAFVRALDDWSVRLRRGVERRIETAGERLKRISAARAFVAPAEVLTEKRRQRALDFERRLTAGVETALKKAELRTAEVAAKLDALSPLAVLGRGYSLTKRARDGRLLRSVDDAQVGETLETRVADGTVRSVVVERSPLED